MGKGFGIVNCRILSKNLQRHNAELSKYNISIRSHVSQGICIPLEVRHDLARKVTTRRIG